MGRFTSILSFLVLWNSLFLDEVAAQGTSLAGGQVVTRTDVQKYADLAQDLAEMQKLADNRANDRVLTLFREGEHAYGDANSRFSLSQLGDELAKASPKTPAFLYHLYGITGLSTNFAFELEAQADYINKFIEETIEENLDFAVDAILTVSVWMYATHLLYDGVYRCHQRTQADDPGLFGDMGGGGFDEFIALYIGEGQSMATESGDSLYRWAHVMGGFFDMNDPQSPVNTRILRLYAQAKDALSQEGACSKAVKGTASELWKLATQIVSQMSIPLFQGLLYSIQEGDTGGIKVYAKALVPQIAKCRPSIYKRLKQNLLDGGLNLDAVTTNEVLDDLQDAYSCFGYTCSSVGIYGDGMKCDLDDENPPLAGYDPLTDVSAVARVDLDVLQIRILASLQAHQFAYFIYMYGTNVFKFGTANTRVVYVSMHDIAVSSERSNAPSYVLFENYWNKKDYADALVIEALTGKSKWLATDQVAAIASLTCAYMITFMEAISKLHIGVQDCKDADGEGLSYTLDPVDEAAALIVGSMGGHEFGGTAEADGQLMYSLANEHAFKFGTKNSEGYASVNKEIIDLLLAARAEIDVLDCENLEISVNLLEKLLTVGIIQAAISSAINNQGLTSISTATSLAEGEILMYSILPYLQKHTPEAAQIVKENMEWKSNTQPVKAGANAVAQAFGKGLTYAIGLRCSYLGTAEGVNPCVGIPHQDGSAGWAAKPRSAGTVSALSFCALFVALVVGFATWM